MLTYNAVQDIANGLMPASSFTTVDAEPEFAKKVRLASVILKANNPISYEDIRRATPGVYFRIALRIAAARFPNISFTTVDATGATSVVDNSNKINFQWLEDDIIAMLTPQGAANLTGDSKEGRLGSFSGGLEWAASKMVAAHVIRNIPLNNSSLKFVDIANTLETQALEDIDRIIQIENATNGGSAATDSESSIVKGQATFCIAHSIDLSSVPPEGFDIPDPGSNPPTYTGTVPFDNVEVVNTLSVEEDEIGICYFYMTGQAVNADQDLIVSRAYNNAPGDPNNSGSVSFKIEKVFGLIGDDSSPGAPSTLPSTLNIDELITLISDEINSETLNVVNAKVANILTAPQRGKSITTPVSSIKRDLYPDTTTNKNRRGLFNLYHRINKLSFEVRRYSNKADTEMITIGFYTVPKTEWQTYKALLNSATPPANPRQLRASGKLGIKGLVFGETDSYSNLGTMVPYSALLNVDKGNVSAVSIDSAAAASGESADSTEGETATNVIDTFYFAYEDTNIIDEFISPFTQDLVLRLSTTSYITSIPLNITVDLTTQPFTNPNFPGNLDIPIGEQIAGRVVDAVYDYTRNSNTNEDTSDNSNVLAVLLGNYQRIATIVNTTRGLAAEVPLEPYIDADNNLDTQVNFSSIQKNSSSYRDTIAGRVQMVAFRYRNEEYRLVIEILSIPNNLWIATGNYILRRTQWVLGRRRSLTAETKVLSSTSAVAETTAEELNSVNASVGKVEASKSKRLQNVYDKIKLIKEAQKGFPNKWHSRI